MTAKDWAFIGIGFCCGLIVAWLCIIFQIF